MASYKHCIFLQMIYFISARWVAFRSCFSDIGLFYQFKLILLCIFCLISNYILATFCSNVEINIVESTECILLSDSSRWVGGWGLCRFCASKCRTDREPREVSTLAMKWKNIDYKLHEIKNGFAGPNFSAMRAYSCIVKFSQNLLDRTKFYWTSPSVLRISESLIDYIETYVQP